MRWWHNRTKVSVPAKQPVGTADLSRRRVLIYCPEAVVTPHLILMQLLGRILLEAGHEVQFPRCERLFERCVAKESVALAADATAAVAQQVCDTCVRSSSKLMRRASLDSRPLSDAVSASAFEQARQVIDGLSDEALLNFTFDGFKFGELCRHDLMLSRKLLIDTPLNAENHLYLRQYLKTVVATYLGMLRFIASAGITDVLFYGQYAANIAVACAARKLGVNWRVVASINHLGVDRRRAYIERVHSHVWTSQMIDDWPEWRDVPLGQGEPEEIGDDILVRFGSASFTTYSPPKTREADVFALLGLDRRRRLVTAFTSSLDEYNSEEMIDNVLGFPEAGSLQRPYADQIEWLRRMANEIGDRDDLQLVIRIHPREDANKRDKVRSRHLDQLHLELSQLPSNVRVVWPADAVSSYDLLEVTDVVQVWSSTIGLESARLGIPVLKVFRGYASYPEGDFARSASTHEELVGLMNEALTGTADFDQLVRAWRFYGYSRFVSSMDLRDVVPRLDLAKLPRHRVPNRIREIMRAIFDETWPWKINRQSPGFLENRLTPQEETVAIKAQLRRVLYGVFMGRSPAAEVPLYFCDPLSLAENKRQPNGGFAVDRGFCTYTWGGKSYTRYSPMCARLAAWSAVKIERDDTAAATNSLLQGVDVR